MVSFTPQVAACASSKELHIPVSPGVHPFFALCQTVGFCNLIGTELGTFLAGFVGGFFPGDLGGMGAANPPENSQLKEETQSVVVCRSSLRLFAVKLVIHTDVDLLSGLGKLVLSESELLLAASGSFCLSLPGSARGSQGSLSALRWLLFFGKLIRPHCLAGS